MTQHFMYHCFIHTMDNKIEHTHTEWNNAEDSTIFYTEGVGWTLKYIGNIWMNHGFLFY